ncbi:hypothetical protein CANCADRAFT_141245 [Tortispora caseinolytica NRRL Y-17796]|uniref:ATP11 protein n=1 Tax=Tortispora caseinolytica NRRL Y-17796 TaxID=767744 RepID=A0A1E4TCW9_9ASCO|nr:hypothetical protein CANCADRAFT_141245 [Tortispora caseinolytica NRRL Y-17796]
MFGSALLRRSRCLHAPFLPPRIPVRCKSELVSKYMNQIEAKAKELGVSTEELLKHASAKPKQHVAPEMKHLFEKKPHKSSAKSSAINDSTSAARNTEANHPESKKIKTLDSFVDVEKMIELDEKSIEYLWRARHQSEYSVSAALDPTTYARLRQVAREYPLFLLPVPRDGGYEMHYLQWSFPERHTVHLIITPLEEYKLHQEFARPHSMISFHSDLLSHKKNVVLMAGQVDTDVISTADVQFLLLSMQKFYTADVSTPRGQRRLKLIADFYNGSPDFSYQTLLDEVDTVE